jgi:methionyl-tRNA formyltransferase
VKAVFMGKCKRSVARSLEWLVGQGCEVAAVVTSEPDRFTVEEQRVDLVAERHGLKLVQDSDLYDAIADPASSELDLGDVDVVVSVLFWKLIREPLISLGRLGCLNFHPAPLPDVRGLGGYNFAVLEGLDEWGVSCHYVDERFDTGDLVQVDRFPIDPATATAWSVDLDSQERLYAQFTDVMGRLLAGEELPREPQGEGRYISGDEMYGQRLIKPGEDAERKLRAFWYPPWPGALVQVDGRELTVVDDGLLQELAATYRAAGRVP